MKIGRGSTRLKLGLVTGVALLAFAAMFVGSARAAESPPADASGLPANTGAAFDPLATNVPYLAWRGEMVRLVGCIPYDQNSYPGGFGLNITPEGKGDGYSGSNDGLSVTVEPYAFSGPEDDVLALPKPVSSPAASVFYDYANGRLCARGSWISDKPGILIAKLTVSYNGVVLIQHDFMVGWMAINSATMTNAGSVTDVPGQEPGNSANVQVTGSIPLNSEFQQDWGLPATLVLPRDWAEWATSGMASANMPYYICNDYSTDAPATAGYCEGLSVNPYYGVDPSAFWDIHDSSAPAALGVTDSPDVHASQYTCPGSTPSLYIDQVDNCVGGWSFSRLFGDYNVSGIGPFDPAFATTLLSDGRLNAADAPMPALEITYNSAGGMGGFDDSVLNRKACVYNVNSDPADDLCVATGHHESEAHALYAPYYGEYIPSTSRDPLGAASGIDSAFQTDNFQAFAGWYGEYNFWQIANVLTQGAGGDSGCLLNGRDRQLNTGATKVVEFTDEHGEARAQWQPGEDADFFANYANNNGKGGCDLEGVTFPNQTLSATAQYPYQPTANPTAVSGTITKVISNLFHKTVSCVAERNPDGSITGYICTVTAQDIDGNGSVMNGEQVCLNSQGSAGDGTWFEYANGNIGEGTGSNTICVWLSGGGPGVPAQAQADLLTTQGTMDIGALFTGEKIVRDACIVYGNGSSTPGPCGGSGGGGTTTTGGGGTTTGGGGTTTGGGSSTTGSTTTTGHGNDVTVSRGKAHKVAAHVGQVQLVLSRSGRVLYVKVLSPKSMKKAKIRISLMSKHNHLMKKVMRTVKTNHRVKVSNLKIGKTVGKVHVVVVR